MNAAIGADPERPTGDRTEKVTSAFKRLTNGSEWQASIDAPIEALIPAPDAVMALKAMFYVAPRSEALRT